MRTSTLALLALAALSTTAAHGVSCGTVAAPTACSITVGGTVKYTFSGFSLPVSGASGGATLYGAADIGIDVSAGAGSSVFLLFFKNNANPGTVFVVNAGGVTSFTVLYNVTIGPAGLGIVGYGPQFAVDLYSANKTSNALGKAQFIVPGVVSCQAIIGIAANHANCAIPPGQPLTFTGVGNIMNLTGNAGSASMSGFSNLFDATFAYRPLDIDGNGNYDALTDGLLLLRYLFNLRGSGLIANAVGNGATRTTAAKIEEYIQLLLP